MIDPAQDQESVNFLSKIVAEHERVRGHRVAGVRTVLVVLSAAGIIFDIESLQQKILMSYPDSAVFFLTTDGDAIGSRAPEHVDLLIDFTGPGQRQGFLFPKKLRRQARVAVGRRVGWLRPRIYDRIVQDKPQEKPAQALPVDNQTREGQVQRELLALAGVYFSLSGDALPDRGKTIARELPGFDR